MSISGPEPATPSQTEGNVYTVWIGAAAGVVQLVAFALYNKQVFQGTSRPNASTWTLWAFLTVLNASSYLVMTGDLVKSILPAASAAATLITFAYSLLGGKLSKVDKWDGIALAIGVLAGLAWLVFKSATYANLILQVSLIVSFVPTYRGVWKDPSVEKALPWCLWSAAYILSMITVLTRWQGQYQDLVYPVLCFFLHVAVAVMVQRKSVAV